MKNIFFTSYYIDTKINTKDYYWSIFKFKQVFWKKISNIESVYLILHIEPTKNDIDDTNNLFVDEPNSILIIFSFNLRKWKKILDNIINNKVL